MKKITALVAATALVGASSVAFAGGPTKVPDDPPVVVPLPAQPTSLAVSPGALAVAGLVAAGVLVLALSDNSTTSTTPKKP
jgi:hypothetical protein